MSYIKGKLVEREGILPFSCRLMTDLCVALFLGAAASVWVYWANDGQFRWFMGAFAAAGFGLWRISLSRPLLFLAQKLAGLLRGALRILVVTPVRRAAALIRAALVLLFGALRFLAAHTVGRAAARIGRMRGVRRTEAAMAHLREDVSFDGEEGTRL